MSDQIFGPLITGTDVADAARDTLKLWTPDYLAWAKRAKGRQLPTPRSWITSAELERWPEESPPAVLIMSTGTVDKPVTRSDGSVDMRYDLGIAVVTTANTEGAAVSAAELYTALFVRILTQHRSLGGFANAVEYVGDEWDQMPDRKRKRKLAVGQAVFVVEVENVLNVRGGPAEPSEVPSNALPDDPTIVQADVVLQPEDTLP